MQLCLQHFLQHHLISIKYVEADTIFLVISLYTNTTCDSSE